MSRLSVHRSAEKSLRSTSQWPKPKPLDIVERRIDIAIQARLLDYQRRYLLEFTKSTDPRYKAGWVHEEICRLLEQFSRDVAAGLAPRLIIQAPPRHGKSMLASERFPVWHLARHPEHEIVVAGYALKPARDRTTESRRVLSQSEVQDLMPALGIRDDTRAKGDWRLEAGGGVLAVGVLGALTGAGADILIVDDPLKGWADAYSALKRDAVWDWYTSTAYTRLAPGGGILIITTRWHEDDLVGRLLDRNSGEGWTVVKFSAIAAEDEEHRKKGDALHPERYSIERLTQIQASLPTRMWEALFMGMPSSPGGSVWRRGWWKHWTDGPLTSAQNAEEWRVKPKQFQRIELHWDLTFGSKAKTASWVVGQAWGKCGEDLFLLEEVRGRWGFVDSRREILAMAARYASAYTYIEDKANGPAVLDDLKRVLKGRLRKITPDGSKIARAHAAASPIEMGNVFLPEIASHPWVTEYLDEVSAFPEGANDDRVDTTSQALRSLGKRRASLVFSRRSDKTR